MYKLVQVSKTKSNLHYAGDTIMIGGRTYIMFNKSAYSYVVLTEVGTVDIPEEYISIVEIDNV